MKLQAQEANFMIKTPNFHFLRTLTKILVSDFAKNEKKQL